MNPEGLSRPYSKYSTESIVIEKNIVEVKLTSIKFNEPRVKLGKGGYGVVYRSAIGGYRGTTVAVKLLNEGKFVSRNI